MSVAIVSAVSAIQSSMAMSRGCSSYDSGTTIQHVAQNVYVLDMQFNLQTDKPLDVVKFMEYVKAYQQ